MSKYVKGVGTFEEEKWRRSIAQMPAYELEDMFSNIVEDARTCSAAKVGESRKSQPFAKNASLQDPQTQGAPELSREETGEFQVRELIYSVEGSQNSKSFADAHVSETTHTSSLEGACFAQY